MKQFSLALNLVLVIAVAVLFYLHFSGNNKVPVKGNTVTANVQKESSATKIPVVAYVELDSLNNSVTFIKQRKKELEAEQKAIATEYESSYRALAAERDEFLKKGNAITQQEAETFQAKLQQKQQEIETTQKAKAQRLAEKGTKIMEDMQARIRAFMKDYNKDKNYSYILATGIGLDYLFYKDSTLSITDDVIKGLNGQANETVKP